MDRAATGVLLNIDHHKKQISTKYDQISTKYDQILTAKERIYKMTHAEYAEYRDKLIEIKLGYMISGCYTKFCDRDLL